MIHESARQLPAEGYRVLRKLRPMREVAPPAPAVPDDGSGDTCNRDETRTDLTRLVSLAFDVLAARRPAAVLRNLNAAERVRTGLTTRIRQGGEKGAALMSLHPDVRGCGTVVHFVGSWSSDRGIRAYAGRADRKSGDGPWSITALRLL